MMRSLKINSETLVIFAYCVYVIVYILSTTQFMYIGGWEYITKFSKYLVLGTILFSFVVSRKISLKWFVTGCIVGAVCLFSLVQSGRLSQLVLIAAFFLAGVHLKSGKLLQDYVLAASAMVLLTLALYAVGIFSYDAGTSSTRGTLRLYLGFTYSTYCANYFFHIVLAYIALKKKDINVKETLIISIVNVIIRAWTDTLAVYYEIFLLLAILWLKRSWPKLFEGRLFRYATIWVMPLMAALSIFLAYTYDKSNAIYLALDRLLTTRLSLGYQAIQNFGFSLFGQKITWVTGRYGLERMEDYFYVDCSYLNIALTFGVVVLVLVVAGFMILGRKACVEKKYFFAIALMLLAVHSFSDPQLFDLKYDPFLILLGAVLLKRGEIPLDVNTNLGIRVPKVCFKIRG